MQLKRMTLLALLVVCTILPLPAESTAAGESGPALKIVEIQAEANPARADRACPEQVKFTGVIEATRQPVSGRFFWERRTGAADAPWERGEKGSFRFGKKDPHHQTTVDYLSLEYKGEPLAVSARLNLMSGRDKVTSEPVTFECGQPVPAKKAGRAESKPPQAERKAKRQDGRQGANDLCELSSPLSAEESSRVKTGQFTDLEARLDRCQKIKQRIVWQNGNGSKVPFDSWPEQMKRRLDEIYQKMNRNGANLGLKCPTAKALNDNNFAFFTAEQAFDIYAAAVAHALSLEAKRQVPWSLTKYPAKELDAIFASSAYHSIILPAQGNDYPPGIKAGRDFQELPENIQLGQLTCDPRIMNRFVAGKAVRPGRNLVGADDLQTLANLTVFIRDNYSHGKMDNSEPHQPWPEDRLRPTAGQKVNFTTDGCHSTAKLMVELARSVNIPLLHALATDTLNKDAERANYLNITHGALLYGWGGSNQRTLWHADEIYAMPGEPSFPIDEQGKLLPTDKAALAYFNQRWLPLERLRSAGFLYDMQTVIPGKGLAKGRDRGAYENHADYGISIGTWLVRDKSDLAGLLRLEESYELCGDHLLRKICSGKKFNMKNDIVKTFGGLKEAEVPAHHTPEEYKARADVCLQGVGGCEEYNRMKEAWKAARGSGLLER